MKQILHPKVGHSQIEILKPISRKVEPSWLLRDYIITVTYVWYYVSHYCLMDV